VIEGTWKGGVSLLAGQCLESARQKTQTHTQMHKRTIHQVHRKSTHNSNSHLQTQRMRCFLSTFTYKHVCTILIQMYYWSLLKCVNDTKLCIYCGICLPSYWKTIKNATTIESYGIIALPQQQHIIAQIKKLDLKWIQIYYVRRR
jgi:hypothetical protein